MLEIVNIDINQIPFFWVLMISAMLTIFFALRAWVLTKKTAQDAGADWDYQVSENMHDERLTREAYIAVYTKVNTPRFPKYAAAAIASIGILTVPAFLLIQAGLYWNWVANKYSQVFEPSYLVWQFSIYFSIIALWALIIGLFTRLYHKRAPGLMRDALIKARQEHSSD